MDTGDKMHFLVQNLYDGIKLFRCVLDMICSST